MPLYLLDAVIVSGDFHSRIALNFTGNRSGDGDLLPAATTVSILKGSRYSLGVKPVTNCASSQVPDFLSFASAAKQVLP